MKLRSIPLIVLLLLVISGYCRSQVSPLKVQHYYPKDSLKYDQDVPDLGFSYEKEQYGKTTMIIHTESSYGFYEFIFKKKIKSKDHFGGDSSEVYGTMKDGTFGVVRKDYNEPYTISQHNLYALVLLHDHGGFIEKVKFQDFGNEVYWPEFDYPNCSVSDEDKDGCPEFYLTYMSHSDGLDAKPYKQIVYTYSREKSAFIKSKATAYYPAGNEDDVYRVEYDSSWKSLPKEVQRKSLQIIKKDRIKRANE